MKTKILAASLCITLLTGIIVHLSTKNDNTEYFDFEENERKGLLDEFSRARVQYEFDMLKDPNTGTIPKGIFEQEVAFARALPVREGSQSAGNLRLGALNTYVPAGPHNIGGRTRALVYDKRYNGTSNRVIISGSVS